MRQEVVAIEKEGPHITLVTVATYPFWVETWLENLFRTLRFTGEPSLVVWGGEGTIWRNVATGETADAPTVLWIRGQLFLAERNRASVEGQKRSMEAKAIAHCLSMGYEVSWFATLVARPLEGEGRFAVSIENANGLPLEETEFTSSAHAAQRLIELVDEKELRT